MVGSYQQPAPLTDFSQYVSSPCGRTFCYVGLAVSSPAGAKTTAGIHCTYQKWMARLSGPEWPGTYWDGRSTKGRQSIPVLTSSM